MPSSNRKEIKELNAKQLTRWLERHDIEAYRAGQILRWVYLRQADRFEQMTDLNKALRQLLIQHFYIQRLVTVRVETSKDGSQKYLFRLTDGTCIESVLIPEKDHFTLCISSQVGCAQGCRFCLTAKGGFIRNLTRGEIISQVLDVINDFKGTQRLSNIVLMGMGEPLANYDNVISAIHTIVDTETGLNFSSRKITLSTAGLVPELLRLGHDTRINLAVSLNATDNQTRSRLMPLNKRYPIENLLKACREYHLQPRGRITFEYILLKGINDTTADAHRLIKLLRPLKSKINLIPFNEHEDSEFRRPEESVVLKFQEILLNNNYTVMIRHSKGQDISAACGQLSMKSGKTIL